MRNKNVSEHRDSARSIPKKWKNLQTPDFYEVFETHEQRDIQGLFSKFISPKEFWKTLVNRSVKKKKQ